MALTVISIHWQTDARLHSLRVEEVVNTQTSYGLLSSTVPPTCDYTETHQHMLCLTLDRRNTELVKNKILSDFNIGTLDINEFRVYLGFCGFLTLEVYTEWNKDGKKEINEVWASIRKDIYNIVEWFSWNTPMLDAWLHTAKDYLTFNANYSFGIHRRLQDTMVRHKMADENAVNDSYVYSYQTVTSNQSESELLCGVGEAPMHEVGTLDGARCWQNFGNHVWLAPNEPDNDLLHRLATSTIIAAYTVLTYDVSVMNYKNMLRLIAERIPFETANIRDAVNIRNLVLQELGLATRDLNAEKSHLTERCLVEYGNSERRQLFLDSQQSLRFAADGIDSGQQSSSSHTIEMVISVLTIMSVYSLVTDSYSLITKEAPHTPFSLVSTALFAATTVFCLITIFVLFRRRKK